MRIFAFLTCLIAAPPVLAQTLPEAGYFTGEYELTGRAPGAGGKALLDWVTLVADTQTRFSIKSCHSGEGSVKIGLEEGAHEGASPLEGTLGDWQLFCRFTNDRDNYPRLTCYAVDADEPDVPGLITLWPAHWDRPDHAQGCG